MNNPFKFFDTYETIELDNTSSMFHLWASSLLFDIENNRGYYRTLFDSDIDDNRYVSGAIIYYPDEQQYYVEWAENLSRQELSSIIKTVAVLISATMEEFKTQQQHAYIMPSAIHWEVV